MAENTNTQEIEKDEATQEVETNTTEGADLETQEIEKDEADNGEDEEEQEEEKPKDKKQKKEKNKTDKKQKKEDGEKYKIITISKNIGGKIVEVERKIKI